jgi:hypothetical protein
MGRADFYSAGGIFSAADDATSEFLYRRGPDGREMTESR